MTARSTCVLSGGHSGPKSNRDRNSAVYTTDACTCRFDAGWRSAKVEILESYCFLPLITTLGEGASRGGRPSGRGRFAAPILATLGCVWCELPFWDVAIQCAFHLSGTCTAETMTPPSAHILDGATAKETDHEGGNMEIKDKKQIPAAGPIRRDELNGKNAAAYTTPTPGPTPGPTAPLLFARELIPAGLAGKLECDGWRILRPAAMSNVAPTKYVPFWVVAGVGRGSWVVASIKPHITTRLRACHLSLALSPVPVCACERQAAHAVQMSTTNPMLRAGGGRLFLSSFPSTSQPPSCCRCRCLRMVSCIPNKIRYLTTSRSSPNPS